ncbi:MAG: single-stranded DNA-binding protein [Bacillota bacterium]
MLNKVILIGRLVKDPELRYSENGNPFSYFRLAVDRNYTNKEGKKETDFVDIITWNRLAETCTNYLRKGKLTAVEGRIQIRKSKRGDKTYINPEIVANNVRFIEWPDSETDQEKNIS